MRHPWGNPFNVWFLVLGFQRVHSDVFSTCLVCWTACLKWQKLYGSGSVLHLELRQNLDKLWARQNKDAVKIMKYSIIYHQLALFPDLLIHGVLAMWFIKTPIQLVHNIQLKFAVLIFSAWPMVKNDELICVGAWEIYFTNKIWTFNTLYSLEKHISLSWNWNISFSLVRIHQHLDNLIDIYWFNFDIIISSISTNLCQSLYQAFPQDDYF